MDVVLVAGLWLDAHAWGKVTPALEEMGHRTHPVTLPGQGDGRASATLDEQLAEVVRVIDGIQGPVMVVGHSAACTLVWMVGDARAERISKVVMVAALPFAAGLKYADFMPLQDGVLPFPGWDRLDESFTQDMNADMRATMEENIIVVPEGVTKATVRYHDEKRYDVPAVVICSDFDVEDAQNWIDSGDSPEMAKAKNLELVNMEAGHWPMFSCPTELAQILDEATKS